MDIELKLGDIFATRNPQGLGKAILLMQDVKSQDGKSDYGHTGIITSSSGDTFEALWTIKEQKLFEAYKGSQVLVARWDGMTLEAFNQGFSEVSKMKDRMYPWYRLVWHALGLARWVHFLKTPVCSEITAHFLLHAGATCIYGENYWGITPDNLVDEWRISKHFNTVFEGVL